MAFTRPKDWHPRKVAECKCSKWLADWLTSNRRYDWCGLNIPGIVICYDYGVNQWPIVPDPPSPQSDPEAL